MMGQFKNTKENIGSRENENEVEKEQENLDQIHEIFDVFISLIQNIINYVTN